MTDMMQRIVLAKRPQGEPADECFRLEEIAKPALGDGAVLVRNTAMSLDPYMRGRMDDVKSYTPPTQIDEVMGAQTVGVVEASNDPAFKAGDKVAGWLGWASHGVAPAKALMKIADGTPMNAYLGVLGMPGFTAWSGLSAYGKMKAGETLVVAAATGPVGSLVGQLAKEAGLRVVGVAGGPDKCATAIESYGFDACIDHRAHGSPKEMQAALAAECPDGIDIYWENVGGPVLGGALPLMNLHGRVLICGMIAWYNGDSDETAAMPLQKLWRMALVKRLTVQGLLQTDHVARIPEFLREVGPKVASGQIAHIQDVAHGLENAPEAFRGLLKGRNNGKQIVQLSEE